MSIEGCAQREEYDPWAAMMPGIIADSSDIRVPRTEEGFVLTGDPGVEAHSGTSVDKVRVSSSSIGVQAIRNTWARDVSGGTRITRGEKNPYFC